MKKISLLLIILCFAISCKSQEILHIVDFKLPSRAKKLDQKQVESFSTTSTPDHPGTYYDIDGIKINFFDGHFSKDNQRSLEQIKRSITVGSNIANHTNESVEIKTINGMRFLIHNYIDYKGVGFIIFYTEWHNDYAGGGTFQFDKADTVKANKVLNEILSTMKFKD